MTESFRRESLPLFEDYSAVAGENRMALEVFVVAGWVVVAEVGAAAFCAGEGALQDRMGDAA